MQKNISELPHTIEKLPWGGEVLVLNDGAIITAEDRAMIQALHSRNPKGVREHLRILEQKGSGNMMSSFYVGYGHKSIGDCGTVTIFVEGISLLAAKALQDSQLYNGQECSTRYIDFSTQAFFNPKTNDLKANPINEKLRKFYVESFPQVVEDLKKKYPKGSSEDEKFYEKAIKARAFDILRGFLPAGATTNVAWSTTLRQVADRLMYLRHHPLKEVREIASKIHDGVSKAYPNSFGHKLYEDTEKFNHEYMHDEINGYYLSPKNKGQKIQEGVKIILDGVYKPKLKTFYKSLSKRKNKTEMPKGVAVCGNVIMSFLLDFGSWRDLQRHRSVIQSMPLLTDSYGFESWYADSLPKHLQKKAKELLKEIKEKTKKMKPLEKQYFVPIGYKVPVLINGDLPALTYIAEIRATSVVHPTLQTKALEMGKLLSKKYKYKVFVDEKDVGRFDVKRGTNDIEMKK
jgi:thymidylate synthase ThyX